MNLIIKTLGAPGHDDVQFVTDDRVREWLLKRPKYSRVRATAAVVGHTQCAWTWVQAAVARTVGPGPTTPFTIPPPSTVQRRMADIVPSAPSAARDLIRRMLAFDPRKRISVEVRASTPHTRAHAHASVCMYARACVYVLDCTRRVVLTGPDRVGRAQEALAHPFVAEYRVPKDELRCTESFPYDESFDESAGESVALDIRREMYKCGAAAA